MATVYVHKTRYSKHIFDHAKYYSICFMDQEHKNQLGYFGRVSGRDENKMEKCGMTVNNQDVAPILKRVQSLFYVRLWVKVILIKRVLMKMFMNGTKKKGFIVNIMEKL